MSNVIEEMCKILGIKKLWTMPYHPQTNGLVERLHQMIMQMIRKLGEDQKSQLAIWFGWNSACTYNATCSTVTRYSPHYLMFRQRPRLPVQVLLPHCCQLVRPPLREASAKHVDEYVASAPERLRTALWEVQAQLTVEACTDRNGTMTER